MGSRLTRGPGEILTFASELDVLGDWTIPASSGAKSASAPAFPGCSWPFQSLVGHCTVQLPPDTVCPTRFGTQKPAYFSSAARGPARPRCLPVSSRPPATPSHRRRAPAQPRAWLQVCCCAAESSWVLVTLLRMEANLWPAKRSNPLWFPSLAPWLHPCSGLSYPCDTQGTPAPRTT